MESHASKNYCKIELLYFHLLGVVIAKGFKGKSSRALFIIFPK